MNIRDLIKNPVVIGVSAFVVGVIFGLVVLGWFLFPVQWKDAPVNLLRNELQTDYLSMAIDSYNYKPDAALAQARWKALEPNAKDVLGRVRSANTLSKEAIDAFVTVVGAGLEPVPGQTPAPTTTAKPASSGGGIPWPLLAIMCVVTLLIGAGAILYFMLGGKGIVNRSVTPAMQANEAARQAPLTDYVAMGEEPPMAQFMASYKLGDDLFDDSFSIDSPSGEFLGECGVGISETIGVGDPKKVAAFEVWMFDKNDIQTVTKVLMSQHAFQDDAIKQRLAAKGEPVDAAPAKQVVLETATLQLVARVVDMSYGEGALPASSFFKDLVLELAVWKK